MTPSAVVTDSTPRAQPVPTTALHFIDGREMPSISGRTFETFNPATGERLATASFGEREDVDRAVDAGWRAYNAGTWCNLAPAARATCLRRIAMLIRDRVEEIARVDALDSGKPIVDARSSVEGAAAVLEYSATLPENMRGHVFAQEAGYFSYSRREPYGVVGAIAPWNFPFLVAVLKTASALAVGNSVVLKMAEQTPLSTSLYAQICAEAGLPDGVLNVVHGDGPTTGAALAEHPRVPKLTFTGSTDVGRRILEASAASIKSCHLELGGKTPNIVLADANLEQALAGSLFTSFWNSGQVCTSGSRLLVQEDVADEFVSKLAERARSLVVGDPLEEETRLGPLVSEAQLERVSGYVAAGVEAGASLVLGGGSPSLPEPHDGGFFIEPTIFTGVDSRMTIAQEEIFGPVLSVLHFRDDDEAIALANDVAYGLAATVWTNALDRALRFAERLQAGTIWTNWPHGGGVHVPYEGHKQSGLGEDGGLEAIGTFTKLKVNNINFGGTPVGW
jgi:acyl-CoA reductase-like NAD-dependent aldehyde dehydrogenase